MFGGKTSADLLSVQRCNAIGAAFKARSTIESLSRRAFLHGCCRLLRRCDDSVRLPPAAQQRAMRSCEMIPARMLTRKSKCGFFAVHERLLKDFTVSRFR